LRQFLGPVDQALKQLGVDGRLAVLATGRTTMLIVRHLHAEGLIEPPVDVQVWVLALVRSDEEDRDLVLSREEQDHAEVVAQSEDAKVLDARARESVVGRPAADSEVRPLLVSPPAPERLAGP
jgi:hypothetical protein